MMSLPGRRATDQKGELTMTQRFKRLSHSLCESKYHIVFCPKYRCQILKEVLELNVQPDHVHLILSIPPKYAVSEFMGCLKGKLALRLFQQYESLGRRY